MSNQSLARIMYGTSDDSHSSVSTTVVAHTPLSAQPIAERADKFTDEPKSLGELLHRVWVNLSNKR